MKYKDIKDKELGDLHRELTDKARHLFDLRTQAVTEKVEDTTQTGKTRKDIARIKTAIRHRELGRTTIPAGVKTIGAQPIVVAAAPTT